MIINWPGWNRARAYRRIYGMMLLLAVLAPIAGRARCPAGAAEGGPDLNGTWKLVAHFSATDEVEWAIFEIKQADGKCKAEVIDTPTGFGGPQIYLEASPEALVVLLAFELSEITFKGRVPIGSEDGRIAGAMQFRTTGPVSTSGARLEKTRARKIAAPIEPPKKSGATSTVGLLVEMRKATAEFLDDRYRSLELNTAVAAAAGVPIDAPTAVRAWAVSRLVDVARRAGKPDVAAESQLVRLKALIDEERRPPAVPLVVKPVASRPHTGGDQAILVELFTGAQCGPCVAADIAFDALCSAYDSTDMIALQYHIHIPGPDPLTSRDSVSRQEYYGVRSTPSSYFNGRAMARGGGPIADARRKFNQYHHVADELLKGKRKATIQLAARRTGDEVTITASAQLGNSADTSPGKPRLRLALVEASVPYTGRNGLSTHHHVVRAMPGGAQGGEFEAGKVRIEEIVSLSKVRSLQELYLKEYPNSPGSRGAFTGPSPPVELKNLNVVAFVQNDSDRSVLDAIMIPIH
jgi:hypothetical protein